eukprot:170401-Chlamydomonas_euryale.AAC.7
MPPSKLRRPARRCLAMAQRRGARGGGFKAPSAAPHAPVGVRAAKRMRAHEVARRACRLHSHAWVMEWEGGSVCVGGEMEQG